MAEQRLVITRLTNPVVSEVRGLIGDFISSGLAEGLSWLDLDNPKRVILQDSKGDSVLSLDDWMADYLPSVLDLQLVVFQPLVDGFEPILQDQLHQMLSGDDTLTKRLLSATSVLIPGAEVAKKSQEIFLTNRVNVVVSPVDGRSPLSPTVKVDGSGDRYFGHAATNLISLLGLWVGQNEFPLSSFTSAAMGVAKPVFVVRSYVRHIDASGLVGSVIDQALTVPEGSFITFDQQGVPFTKVQPHAQQGVVREVAKEFITQNKSMLALGAAAPFKNKQRTGRTLGELLKEYFSFIGSVVQTPGTWARTKFNEMSGGVANKVQSAFLGKDSEYEIFVNGVSGVDSNVEMDAVSQLVSAADSIRGNVQRPAPPNPGNLWSDMAAISSSLVDAAEISSTIEMPGVKGGARDIITTPSLLVRSGESDLYLVSPSLPIPLAGKVLKPSDPYLYVLTKSQIDEALLNKRQKLSGAQLNMLQEAKVELESWGAQQNSFLWAVGEQIANSLNEARKALLPQALQVDDELDQKMLIDMEIRVRKSFMRIILGALGIVVIGGLAWLAQATYLNFLYGKWPSAIISNWGLPLFAFLGFLMLWLIIGSIIFDRGVRELFALRHKRMEARARAEHAQLQRAHLITEILRLGEIYAQFQAWSSLLSPPILAPVHLSNGSQNALGKIRLSDLPSSFSQGSLTVETAKVSELSDRVRQQFFSVGWLQRTINGYLSSLGADLGRVWQESPSDARASLTKAMENFQKELDSGDWKDGSSALARQIAIQSANYQSWPLATDFGKGKLVDSSEEFMQELASGAEALPGVLLTDSTTVARSNSLDSDLSRLYLDSRLKLNSEVRVRDYQPFESASGRELDLMAVRLDVSSCMGPANLSFVSAEAKRSQAVSSSTEAEPEA